MSNPNDIVIVAAGRTPVGSFNGSFSSVPAHELGATVIAGVLERAGVDGKDVDEVILGQVLTAGQGQNPARQASINAGLPIETTAWNLNQVCGSGLRAVALGMQQIANGDADVIVAGGQENMSASPHLLPLVHHARHLRAGRLPLLDLNEIRRRPEEPVHPPGWQRERGSGQWSICRVPPSAR